jgi:hypothetical protein
VARQLAPHAAVTHPSGAYGNRHAWHSHENGMHSLLSREFDIIYRCTFCRRPKALPKATEKGHVLYVLDPSGLLREVIPSDFPYDCRPSTVELAIGTASDLAQSGKMLQRDNSEQLRSVCSRKPSASLASSRSEVRSVFGRGRFKTGRTSLGVGEDALFLVTRARTNPELTNRRVSISRGLSLFPNTHSAARSSRKED